MDQQINKIPITVITGFLGSGKTTLLQKILKDMHGKRIAVIENEYGALGLDHELIDRVEEEIIIVQNGCICCSIRKDLIEAILQLNTRRDLFDEIVIETTGLADPFPISQTLLSEPRLRKLVSLDSIVTVVDTNLFEQNFAEKNPEFQSQIAFADLIVMSKVDLVSPTQLEAVETMIHSLNAGARVVKVTKEKANVAEIFGQKLFAQKPMKLTQVEKPSLMLAPRKQEHHHPHTQVFSEVFELKGQIDTDRFQAVLQMFLGIFGHEIYRMKGVIRIEGEDKLTLIQVVRHMLSIDKLDFDVSDEIVNRFVVIAQNDAFKPFFAELLKMSAKGFDLEAAHAQIQRENAARGEIPLET
ncbi:MAG: GTP-binding protein [Bdellovibrionales bacterium]|nr:GTP-binding protein [Bdellovibrionales bacterium]